MAKRSQIAVGQEWAYNTSRQHEHKAWGGYEKVVVVAVEPYEKGYSKNYQVQSGNGVLIKVVSGSGAGYEKVVQLSQLWKPWAEYEIAQAEFRTQWEITQKKAAIAKAKRQEFQEKVYLPAYKEFIEAVEAISGQRLSGYTEVRELPIEVIKAITEAVKEKAVA